MNSTYDRPPRLSPTTLLVILAIGALLGAYLWPELSRRFSRPEAQPRLVEPRGDLAADERSTIELFQKASPSIYSPSGASAGIGFAVPVDTVNRVVPRIIAQGGYTRPSFGIYNLIRPWITTAPVTR